MRAIFRLLPLPFCIAVSLAASANDDIPPDWSMCPIEDAVPAFPDAQAPTSSPDDRESQPTLVDGDETDGIDGGMYNVTGNVTLRRGDQFLGTDALQFDQETGIYTATGNVRYQDSGMRIVADRLEGDQDKDSHRIDNVRYQLIERRGNGGAERIDMSGTRGRMMRSTYSTCPPSERMWELRAQRIDVDSDTGMGTARSATLHIGKVPVLYVPWAAFPIDDRRRTGLLYPNISYSGRNGFDYTQPIYLNLAPNYDMTLEPRWMSRRGIQLGTEFRYLTETGRGVAEVEFLPSDRLTEAGRADEIANGINPDNWRRDNRGSFRFSGVQDVDSRWQARARLNWISDPRWVEDASSSLDGLSDIALQSDVGIYGRSRHWSAALMADYWVLSDYNLADANLPYHRLPRAVFRWEQPFGRWLVAGAETELARFEHADRQSRPGGSRLFVKPYVSVPFEGASWFVRPTLAWRYTGYRIDDALAQIIADGNGFPTANTSPSSSIPITTVDAGLFFDRHVDFRGETFLNTLEPRIFYLHAPFEDQRDMPLFDTGPLSFSWGQLFRDNRYSGADRQADANQLTLAMTTRMIRESDGREKLSASIGQIFYFDESRTVVGSEIPVDDGRSAWVADSTYAINDRWTIGASYQWNPTSRSEDLASVRTRYLVGDDGIVNLSYRYRRNPLTREDLVEHGDFSFLYPINPTWSVVGRYYYSFNESKLLEGIFGVQWESCCMAARLVTRRYVRNRSGDMNNAIQLEIEFKGLGSAGPETRDRLRRAILGYYRDDLYLVPPSEVRSRLPQDDTIPLDTLP
ncbi:LPS-assembly protein LptD [Luteimonas aestuarii]|uniref:LPS-assembly protein LptD n=1 Tax=Luteimonas aestuarii TaxID=453837 RepID=A0A4R5TK21_9GAMM|nr:LPS assembly protein LptD [Luteimonas aestuarii]TDK21717.1 LPS-assembly protein LptD [Luteimonas aestuarii]